MSIQNIGWGVEGPRLMYTFSAKSSSYCFINMLFLGGEGVCKKSMVCMLMKMMFKKMTTPYETSYEIATSEDFIGL